MINWNEINKKQKHLSINNVDKCIRRIYLFRSANLVEKFIKTYQNGKMVKTRR